MKAFYFCAAIAILAIVDATIFEGRYVNALQNEVTSLIQKWL